MATLDQLKTRIILEVDRDDMGSGGELNQALIDAYTDAIEHYSDQLFWFNRANGSVSTVAGSATIAMPAGVRFAQTVACDGEALRKVPLADIQHRTETGEPSLWADNEGSIQLWPIPDGVYPISVYGLASTGVPAAGSDSNIWTTEAGKLIVARSKATLFRILKEYDAMQAAQAEEAEALSRLRAETRHRVASPLRTDFPPSAQTFNIIRGW